MINENQVLKIGGRIAKAILVKKDLGDLKQLIDQFKENIKTIDWREIEIVLEDENLNTVHFSITLPNKLMNDFDIIIEKINSLDSVFIQVGSDMLWGGEDSECDGFNITIQISKVMNNRIDITGNGLPIGFRGLGLGKKIYKKVISEVNYISSEEHKSYKYSHLLWSSLIIDKELYLFMNKDWVYAFPSTESPGSIISRIEVFFKHNSKGECAFDEEFVARNIAHLKESKIAHLFD